MYININRAKEYACNAHYGQVRKSNNEPYYNHPLRVYEILRTYGITNHVILSASLLHDTIEDTDNDFNDIDHMFGIDIANMVYSLSSNSYGIKKYGKAKYLSYKMIKMEPSVLIIKLADRKDNISDIDIMPKSFAIRYLKQTIYIINYLRDNGNHCDLVNKLIDDIETIVIGFMNEINE